MLARGFRTPLGLAWSGSTLFVSAQGSLHRLVVRGKRVVSRRAILTGLPFGRHQQDTVAVGPDGRLYLGSGSTCDACVEKDARSAAILSVRAGRQRPARRRPRPAQPVRARLRAGDRAGSTSPTTRATISARASRPRRSCRVEPGADYGWPGCWSSWRQREAARDSCRGVTRPVALLEPHSSANSLAFWRGRLFVAEWGQYLSERWGRKLVRVDVRTGRSTTFADGFEHPLGLAVEPGGGALLVGDWGRGVVYRIRPR